MRGTWAAGRTVHVRQRNRFALLWEVDALPAPRLVKSKHEPWFAKAAARTKDDTIIE